MQKSKNLHRFMNSYPYFLYLDFLLVLLLQAIYPWRMIQLNKKSKIVNKIAKKKVWRFFFSNFNIFRKKKRKQKLSNFLFKQKNKRKFFFKKSEKNRQFFFEGFFFFRFLKWILYLNIFWLFLDRIFPGIFQWHPLIWVSIIFCHAYLGLQSKLILYFARFCLVIQYQIRHFLLLNLDSFYGPMVILK